MAATRTQPSATTTRKVTRCIVCDSDAITQFLDLGETPLANKFLDDSELSGSEGTYPLKVGFCRGCGHVQLTEIVPPLEMFDDYLYISSASDTLRDHLFDLAKVMVERRRLGDNDLVIDIGCNDATLLRGFQRFGLKTLGVDPARNLASFAADEGIDRYVGLFDSASADIIVERWGKAALITATNTFPHIPELHDFLIGIDKALAPGGAFVIEAHYLVDMIEQGAFDTIYHEHVSYWALRPMMRLFERHGFEVVDAERLPLHHGQLRVTVQRSGEGTPNPRLSAIVDMEQDKQFDKLETFEKFAAATRGVKEELWRTLSDLRSEGKRVVGYGAPAKGNTLMSYLEIGRDTIDYIVDRSPLKQGLHTPGSHVPIVPVERLLEDQPDYALLLAWNFADEVLEQQAEYRRRGGKFIVPVPRVRVI
jgi:SAM-dependent methyltransferase